MKKLSLTFSFFGEASQVPAQVVFSAQRMERKVLPLEESPVSSSGLNPVEDVTCEPGSPGPPSEHRDGSVSVDEILGVTNDLPPQSQKRILRLEDCESWLQPVVGSASHFPPSHGRVPLLKGYGP